ncbi:LysM domain/BON superfamily protein [compost metagenome]
MKSKSKTYTVKSGDTLSKIAKLELGSSSKWKDIYNLNKAVIGSDPKLIKPGQRLVLPS